MATSSVLTGLKLPHHPHHTAPRMTTNINCYNDVTSQHKINVTTQLLPITQEHALTDSIGSPTGEVGSESSVALAVNTAASSSSAIKKQHFQRQRFCDVWCPPYFLYPKKAPSSEQISLSSASSSHPTFSSPKRSAPEMQAQIRLPTQERNSTLSLILLCIF